MFGLSWTEIALIGVVAMVLIGPKDLPVAMRAVAEMVKKARRMAGEFQGHVDEMMRDSNLKEVRDSISEIRGMDIGGNIRRHVDADGSLSAALAGDPFSPTSLSPTSLSPTSLSPTSLSPGSLGSDPVKPSITATPLAPHPEQGTLSIAPAAPAFVPPEAADAGPLAGLTWGEPPVPVPVPAAPAFIPPDAAHPGH